MIIKHILVAFFSVFITVNLNGYNQIITNVLNSNQKEIIKLKLINNTQSKFTFSFNQKIISIEAGKTYDLEGEIGDKTFFVINNQKKGMWFEITSKMNKRKFKVTEL